MSATYNELLPSPLDRARSLLGDTEVTPAEYALHSNEHIAAVMTAQPTFSAAVAYLADELVVRFAQEPVRVTVSGKTVDYTPRLVAWQTLAARMRQVVVDDSTSSDVYSGAVW